MVSILWDLLLISISNDNEHSSKMNENVFMVQLIAGNFGLSYEQSKSQFALWAIWASPLLMSVDLRTIRPEYKAILTNRKIIGVNQDILGIQGRRIYKVCKNYSNIITFYPCIQFTQNGRMS